jgi:hypothetical protein
MYSWIVVVAMPWLLRNTLPKERSRAGFKYSCILLLAYLGTSRGFVVILQQERAKISIRHLQIQKTVGIRWDVSGLMSNAMEKAKCAS